MQQPVHEDLKELREFALSLPGATEDFPFGHSVIKVNKKAFAFLGSDDDGRATIALKLPRSGPSALALGCSQPTGYGLGRSGWVTVALHAPDTPPPETLIAWVEESYRTIAPKRVVAQWDAGRRDPEPRRK